MKYRSVKFVIVAECIILLLLYIARCYYTILTGFVLADEAMYYYKIFQFLRDGGDFYTSYSSRYLYQFLMLGLSIIFRANNIVKYVFISTMISVLSTFGIICILWKILKDSGLEQKYTLLTIFFLPPFLMVVPFGLTETVSMFAAVCGIYFIRRSEKMKYGILSAIFIISAMFLRETYTYWIFFLGNLIYMIAKISNRKSVVAYLLTGTVYYISFDWICKSFFLKLDSRFILSTNEGYVSLLEMIRLFIKNFFIGYIISYSILGIVIIYAIVYYWKNYLGKNSSYDLIFWEGILGVVIASGCIFWQSRSDFYDIIRVDTVRQFNISIFLVLIVSILYIDKPKLGRKVFSVMVVFCTVSGLVLFTLPSSVNISNFSLSYRTPWLKVSNYLEGDTSRILVVGEPVMRLDLYLYMYNRGVNTTLLISESEFSNIICYYDRVFIYGEYHYNYVSTILYNYPWYLDLIENRTQYKVRIIWNDFESYFSEVIK